MTMGAPSAQGATSALPLPNFLVIGAARSGTTSLARWLRAHPDIFMSPRKEVHFFDVHFGRGIEWYRDQFTGHEGEPAVGEATPRYLYLREAQTRIAAALPGARLIAVLRNPVDRAYSHFWLNRRKGREPLDFVEALAAEPARLAAGSNGHADRDAYLDRGRYLGQLQSVCRHFPRSSLSVLLFDDIVVDPVGTYRTACRFLGVRDDVVPDVVGEPAGKAVTYRSLRLRRLTTPLPRRLRLAVAQLNRRTTNYPTMDESLRRRLIADFKQDNEALGAWLGRDLSAWNE